MTEFQILKQDNKESAAAEAGEYLNKLLIENKNKPILLMLSAGSAFSILDYVGKNALGENVSISVLDDRFSQDSEANNFSKLQKTDFYTDALESNCDFFGTLPRSDDTLESLAKRWETNLRDWKRDHPQGIIIATLGMGADGHTAGLLPYPENADEFKRLFESEAWVTAYNAGNKNPFKERVTTTVTFLKLVDFGLAFVCGAEKKTKLNEVVAKNQTKINELPALAWHQIKNLKIFTDIAV